MRQKRINKSLLTLGIVIDKLIKKSRHVPYRDSNLTRLLQNCLGGNSRCALCVNISPSSWHYGESMSTLYFGCRTRSIKNKPKSNKFLSAAQLQENLKKYNEQIQENRKTISQLDSQLGDVREFFDIIRNSKEAAALCDFLCCERFNLKCPRGLQEFKTNKNESMLMIDMIIVLLMMVRRKSAANFWNFSTKPIITFSCTKTLIDISVDKNFKRRVRDGLWLDLVT